MYKSVAIILVLLVVLVAASVHGVVHIHARLLSALAWGDARASSTPATITVNSAADVAADDGQCTLREAMVAANTDMASGGALGECTAGPGDDMIDMVGISVTIQLASSLPAITSNVVFEGPGATNLTIRRNSGGDYRIFAVDTGATVRISGLAIGNGLAIVAGGGIYNAGTLTVNHCTIADNEAVGEGPFAGVGGGIFSENDPYDRGESILAYQLRRGFDHLQRSQPG
jgi:CSLREA domain-containing protein